MSAEIVTLGRDWQSALIVSGRDRHPLPLLANVITALKMSPEWAGRLYFNEFSQRHIIQGETIWSNGREISELWTDQFDVKCAEWMQRMGIHVETNTIYKAIDDVARDQTYHPVREYLESLQHDPTTAPASTWLSDYLGVEKSAYTIGAGICWLMSCVARVYEPGCKADAALVLYGKQGLRKSSAMKVMGGEWFTDDLADIGNKDAAMQLAGAWIIELAELGSIQKSEMEKVKAFMSRSVDRYRPPYGRRIIDQPRQCIFGGTTNNLEFLKDESGGRRFWPIVCGEKIDIEGLQKARDAIWAHAVYLYNIGGNWWLPDIAIPGAELQQKSHLQHDVWEQVIETWLLGRSAVTLHSVMTEGLLMRTQDCDQASSNRVVRCLRVLGWDRKQRRVEGERQWLYVRNAITGPVTTSDPDDGDDDPLGTETKW